MHSPKLKIEDEVEKLQKLAFNYFLNETNPTNGLVLDKTAENWPASIAATGFALASYPIAVERGYMSRGLAAERTLNTLGFFWNSTQDISCDATGYKGFYYHFLDMKTGRRAFQSELSTVDSAFLLAGMLTAGMYFDANTANEQEIRNLSEALYARVDWRWAQNQGNTLAHGWTPESGFLPYRWEGYDEAMLLYILALGSPTHPIPPMSYSAWSSTYQWQQLYGISYLHAGSLFTHQLSHIWIDFREIQDKYMREKGINYFENSRRATLIQQQYAIQNPKNFIGYSPCCWGITASDGPGPAFLKIDGLDRQFFNYVARAIPEGPDDGTIAPWAAIASLPFAPEIVLPMIEHCIYKLKLKEGNQYGFKSTFNLTYRDQSHSSGWISPWHFGINLGPMILMIENYRTGFLWNLMRNSKYLIQGLKQAGFIGNYLID